MTVQLNAADDIVISIQKSQVCLFNPNLLNALA